MGITNVGRFNEVTGLPDPNGYPGITMTTFMDKHDKDHSKNLDGTYKLDGQADSDSPRTIDYRVWDTDGDGRFELRRRDSDNPNPNNWDLVFDGIEDISFAFAYDTNNDWDLERANNNPLNSVVWAIDTDNVPGLDTNSDNVSDGDINIQDDSAKDGEINAIDGSLGTQINLRDIRAVRIWLLARSETAFPKHVDRQTYVLAHKVIDMTDPAYANQARFYHRMLTGAVALWNYEY